MKRVERIAGIVAIALVVAVSSSSGCSPRAARTVRRFTYPPDFNYISNQQLKSAMWRLAQGVTRLNKLMTAGSERGDTPRDEVVGVLDSMEEAAKALGPGKWPSNHPRIGDNVDALRRDIHRARLAAQHDPPDYFFAGTISGACLYCHGRGS